MLIQARSTRVSDEQRQERLALSARNNRLVRSMLGLGQDYRARDYSVIRKRVSTSPSKIRFR